MKRKGKIQKQEQIIISAYDMEVIQKSFDSTLRWLEFYIEKSGYSGNWKRQISETIKRDDLNQPSEIKRFMEAALLALDGMIENKPDFILENLQEKFYSWLAESGIRADDCPEELIECLVDIHKVLNNEGKEFGERVDKEASESIARMTPEERRQKFCQTLNAAQRMMDVAREREKGLEGKTYKDVETKNRFTGNSDQGKKLFDQIKSQQSAGFSSNPLNNFEIIQDVKTNSQNWRLDEIPTETNYFGTTKKREWLLIHRDAREGDFDQRKLNFSGNSLYKWENFNSRQRFEIKQAKNLLGDYSTEEEIKWVVKEVRENPRVWEVRKLNKKFWLVHNSAQVNDKEIGTLIHNQQKFSKEEWTEINETLERVKLIDKIKQHINEFEFQKILTFTGQYWDKINKKWVKYNKEKQETMLVHKSIKITENDYNGHGYLNINTDKMFQENRFNQAEWVEIQSALKVNDIKQNSKLEKDLVIFNQETGEYYEADDWFIHNSLESKVDKTGCLIYDPSGMIRAKDLTEAEQIEVGYKKVSQTQIRQSGRSQGGGSSWGFGSSKLHIAVASSVSIISLICLFLTR
ncbi:MAG: hypothetical protein MRERC_7c083 [Mycoplasmataceae bacterium RC_NB112A]|nr:MAG: hypothetical protein MRERC_7c083 [Mycoplasmataceae bacterium RC_NB112A]